MIWSRVVIGSHLEIHITWNAVIWNTRTQHIVPEWKIVSIANFNQFFYGYCTCREIENHEIQSFSPENWFARCFWQLEKKNIYLRSCDCFCCHTMTKTIMLSVNSLRFVRCVKSVKFIYTLTLGSLISN